MQLFLTAFESVPDPRAENVRHDLVEILLIAFLAVLCGARHCSGMAEFGCAKRKFLSGSWARRHRTPAEIGTPAGCRRLPEETTDHRSPSSASPSIAFEM
jgi:hypothetical protein